MKISKELLSEVLGYTPFEIDKIKQVGGVGLTLILLNQDGTVRSYQNIYQLAHKCKEWAFKRKFDFEIIRIKHGKDYGKIFVRIHTIHTNRVNGKEFYPFEEEPEAIFKACEWILKENNGNK